MTTYSPLELFDVDRLLDDDERDIAATVRKFVDAKLRPNIEGWFESGTLPKELAKEFGGLGVMGMHLEGYGCAGTNAVSYGLACMELEAGDSGFRSFVSEQGSMSMFSIYRWGSEEQKQEWLPRLATGDAIGCFGLTEADFGSNPAGMRTRARRDGSDWVINGTKMWITNGPDAHVYVIYAKTDPQAGSRGITAFIVERDYPGFSRSPKLDKLGMRGSNTCELVFEDVPVPARNVLGSAGDGVKILMSGLDFERALLAAGPVGVMQACIDEVLPYLHQRQQFGRPIGEFQLMQGKLADMYADLNACRAYLYAVARACDRDRQTRQDCAAVILYTAEKATQMALQTIQALGGFGYTNESGAGRLLRDAKLYEIGAGTSEIRRMLIGRELFAETC